MKMEEILKQIARNTRPKPSFQFIVSGNTTEFTTKFNPPIRLGSDSNYEVALANLETYYSFPNINETNNVFRYSADRGSTWINIKINTGSYEIEDLNEEIQLQLKLKGHYDRVNNHPYITISAKESALRSVLEINNSNYRVDFNTPNSVSTVLGFNGRIYSDGYHESENIVNILTLNSILVEIDIINGSYVNGRQEPVIYSFFPNVAPGFKIVELPLNLVNLPVCGSNISSLTVRLKDQDGKLLDLRGETITMRFHMRQL